MAKPRGAWGDSLLIRAIQEHMGGLLFHRTDRSNIPSIEEHGLLSLAESRARGIAPNHPGGNGLTRALDARRGIEDHVFLSLSRALIMPKIDPPDRTRNPFVVHVDPEVIRLPGVELRLGRGAYAEICPAMQAYYKMDWEILSNPELREDLRGGRARWKTFLEYEVIVPKCVPRHYLLGND